MNCPVCDAKLREVTKMGVQVDICPDCKGVWLDRGELEKIIQMVEQGGAPAPMPERSEPRRDYREHDKDHRDDHKYEESRHNDGHGNIDPRTGRPRKRGGMLGEIFDMFGGD